MLKAKKLILAGDPMQLGPTVISEGNLRHQKTKDLKMKTSTAKQEIKPPVLKVEPQALNDKVTNSDASGTESSSVGSETEEDTAAKTISENKRENRRKSGCLLRPPRSLNKTLFDRLEDMYGPKIKHTLDVQYRLVCILFIYFGRQIYP